MPDRYGEETKPSCRNPNCRNGWVTPPDSDAPRLCYCRDKPRRESNDYAERQPSARAQAAIEAAEREIR